VDNVTIVGHPLVQDKLTRLRDIKTQSMGFRVLLKELSSLMAFEVTRNLDTQDVVVKTPLDVDAKGVMVDHSQIVLIPILRAGIGMMDGVLEVIPQARVGHIGIYRDPETLEAVQYYQKLPSNIEQAQMVLLIDPMLATGHTMAATLDVCREAGIRKIRIMCLVAAPEGIQQIRKNHKDIPIYAAAVDDRLNDHGYILPGLGDAGDRIFGTK